MGSQMMLNLETPDQITGSLEYKQEMFDKLNTWFIILSNLLSERETYRWVSRKQRESIVEAMTRIQEQINRVTTEKENILIPSVLLKINRDINRIIVIVMNANVNLEVKKTVRHCEKITAYCRECFEDYRLDKKIPAYTLDVEKTQAEWLSPVVFEE